MEECLRQYVELYESNRHALDANSAPVLNTRRPQACSNLRKMRLPRLGEENYEATDLAALLSPDYGLNLNRVRLDLNPAESFRCGVPRMSTSLFFLVNDLFEAAPGSREELPEGVEVESLRKMALAKPEVVDAYYNCLADPENPIAALSTLLVQDGLWIRIPRGVALEKPLQLVNLLGGVSRLMAVRRVVIVVEECAKASLLICDHTNYNAETLLGLETIEVFAGAGSHFELYDIEESSEKTSRLCATWVRQEADSKVVLNGMTIYNGKTRNEYHCLYAAPGSELKLYGMGIADKERVIDNYSVVNHSVGHCHTDELFKYSVDDKARCAFAGLVKVAYGAEKTEAYQSNRNLVGSDEARMFSKPQLEIYNDDVKCSHGSATGRLDEKQLFYMRTRGLDEQEARLLLKQAFMADVIESVAIPGLRERLIHMVERRFAGETSGCRDCTAHCRR